jgi:hypothetical protein
MHSQSHTVRSEIYDIDISPRFDRELNKNGLPPQAAGAMMMRCIFSILQLGNLEVHELSKECESRVNTGMNIPSRKAANPGYLTLQRC